MHPLLWCDYPQRERLRVTLHLEHRGGEGQTQSGRRDEPDAPSRLHQSPGLAPVPRTYQQTEFPWWKKQELDGDSDSLSFQEKVPKVFQQAALTPRRETEKSAGS